MNRAVTRSGKDGAITHLRNRSATCSPVSKATAIRDIDAKTHMYHVPWKFGGTEIRVVQDRNGRYLHTDRCPTSVNKAGAPSHDHAGRTEPGARRAPTSGPNTRSADRTGTEFVSPPTLTLRLSHPVVILTAKWSQTTGEQRLGHSRSQQKG